tara:strand:- start:203 stop:694 length:492 start_codon:yes stop_codon:yes gene_type:complete
MVDEWNKLDTQTLTGTNDNITTGTIVEKKFIQIISNVVNAVDSIDYQQRFGTGTIDTGNNYTRSQSINGGAESTSVNRSNIDSSVDSATPQIMISYAINVSGYEHLVITNFVAGANSGAGSAPARSQTVGKWVTTTQFDITEVYNSQAGDFNTDSNLTVFGTD